MRQATRTQPVEKLDPVWDRIRSEAEEIARAEPALGGFIFSLVLNHDNFEEALTHRLAQRLGNPDIGSDLIVHAFNDAIEAEPEIGHAARADIIATFDRDPACHRYIDPLLYFKGYQAIQTHRMAHRLWHMGRKDFAYYLQSRLSIISAIDIHPAARIGKGIMVDHGHDIVIGETTVIEDNVSIMQGVTLGGTGKEAGDRHPKIRRGVLVAPGPRSWAISRSATARASPPARWCCMTCRRTPRWRAFRPRWWVCRLHRAFPRHGPQCGTGGRGEQRLRQMGNRLPPWRLPLVSPKR